MRWFDFSLHALHRHISFHEQCRWSLISSGYLDRCGNGHANAGEPHTLVFNTLNNLVSFHESLTLWNRTFLRVT